MFSATEYQYIHDMLINYYNQGYENYVCITNNPTDYSNNNVYDVYCFVSKDNIKNENNHFILSTGKKISFDSNNYSNNNTIDKVVVENLSFSTSVLEDKQEFIYSNVGGYADVLGSYSTSLNNHLDFNFAYLIPALLMLLFIVNFVKSCFRSRR